jgi:D-beta-D-heptose 7-phosphate kinase/D-beta-D-heptose 1-phosphate adenosyltransferase
MLESAPQSPASPFTSLGIAMPMEAPETVYQVVQEGFGRQRVLVVGDLMLDCYLWGRVDRISPEAPVPVVRLNRRSATPGGSGNTVLNLAGLGIKAVAAGFVGDDPAGQQLLRLLADAGVSPDAVVTLTDRPTSTKTRVICGHHQMLRLDEEETGPVDSSAGQRLLDRVRVELDAGVAAVILSDYAKGVLTEDRCRLIITEARERALPVLVDPKGRSFAKYTGATMLTPNLREFQLATGVEQVDGPEFLDAARRLRDELRLDFLVVTCGDRGMMYLDGDKLVHHPTIARQVYDVSGAGDTVIATLAAALVAGLNRDDAIQLANLAARVVVAKVGTTPIEQGELLDTIRSEYLTEQSAKVCDLATLRHRLETWRARQERIVFTNGCFDLLHVGHVTLLARAKQEGDRLIVGLNTDRSVRALKGETRPVVTQADRAHVLAGLTSVDAVILFDEDTPLQLLEQILPDVLVKGGDYQESQIVGADLVRSHGGVVKTIPLIEGRSSSQILTNAMMRRT